MSDRPTYDWIDFEPEPDLTGDGEGDPDKHIILIREDGEEFATIVHRTCGGKYPLDGPTAEEKRRNAEHMIDALNAYDPPPTYVLHYTSADDPNPGSTWSVWREEYRDAWSESPIAGSTVHVCSAVDEATADQIARLLQTTVNGGPR